MIFSVKTYNYIVYLLRLVLLACSPHSAQKRIWFSHLRKGGGMSKRKYRAVEMIDALKQLEAGRTAAEVGRELGVSKHTMSSLGPQAFHGIFW